MTIAVICTWLVVLVLLVALGSLPSGLVRGSLGVLGSVRVAMWSGLGILVLLLAVANLFVPLRSTTTVATVLAVAALSLMGGILLWRRGRSRRAPRGEVLAWWIAVPLLALTLALVVIAHSFAGPIDNWDAGLYQLNAIQYAAEYRIIPGLANFHERLGTNMSSSLIGAFLTSTPWGIDAFRLLVGFFALLFASDLGLRLLDVGQRARPAPGLVVMLLGALAAFPFLLTSPGTWVTSPTPDSISMLLVIVAAAYLADAFSSRSEVWAVTAAIVAVLAATVRTQLWVFAGVVVIVLVAHGWRARGGRSHARSFLAFGSLLVVALGLVMMIRDAILSGWLLFPASAFPLPVEWRVPDPAASRAWILSWARQPGSSPDEVLNSWSWLWPWVGRSVADWAIKAAIGFVAASIAIAWFSRLSREGSSIARGATSRVGWRGLALLLLPFVLAVAVWFWTAPDPRFAWGPILCMGIVPASLALVNLRRVGVPRHAVSVVVAAFMTAAVLGPAVAGVLQIRGFVKEGFVWQGYSFGPLALTAAINPVPTPQTAEFTLDGGQVITTPTQDDKCHLAFPLCRPYPDPTLRFRGDSVQDGFISGKAG